jgi:signal transduction histidine kinase
MIDRPVSTTVPDQQLASVVSSDRHPGLWQRRQVLWIVTLASLPLIVLVLAGIWQGKVRAEQQVADERIGLAHAGALTAFAFVDGNLSTARSLARVPVVTGAVSTEDIDRFLNQVLAENPDWDGWGLAAPDGWNIASTGAAPHTLNVADRPYFQQVIQTDRPTVSPAVFNRRLGSPTVVLAAPINFAEGGRGAVIVSLSTARLANELGALRQDTSIRFALVDSDGKLFVHPDAALVAQLPSLRGQPTVDAGLAGQADTTIETSPEGREIIMAYAPVPELGWAILVSQPTDEAFEVVRRQTLLGLVVLTLATVMAGGIGWYLGGRLAESYRRQQQALAQVEATAQRLVIVSAESERRRRFFEGVIESAPIAIAVLRGPEYRYEAVNTRFQALRPNTPMLGRTVADVFPESLGQGSIDVLDRVYQTGEPFSAADRPTDTIGGDDGPSTRYFTYVIARLDDENGRPDAILSVILDTTEAVLTRQQAERGKDEFLSTASHELKTPLTALGLAAQLIDRVLAQPPPLDEARLLRHIRTIQDQVSRMSRLINDLLDTARMDAGRLTLKASPINLVALARDAADRQRDALQEEGRDRVSVQADRPSIVVQGDPVRLGQVLTNLLSNAVKYSPAGGPVDVMLTASPDLATIEVVDHGIGIPEEERADVFSPFRRASTAVAAAIEGTGLGLYITRRIVEAHGGSIRLVETPGGGSTFEVTLPLAEVTGDREQVTGDGTAPL